MRYEFTSGQIRIEGKGFPKAPAAFGGDLRRIPKIPYSELILFVFQWYRLLPGGIVAMLFLLLCAYFRFVWGLMWTHFFQGKIPPQPLP